MADRGRKAFPVSSPVIFEYDCEQRYKIHKNRVSSARSVVNTAPPEDFLHFHYNAKKCMKQAERLYDVERANRILLEKMTKYQEFNGAQHLRPWASRGTVNFKNGMVYRQGTGLHIDNLNVPVNAGTIGGSMKTDYTRRKALEKEARDNMRMRDKIEAAKPVYSAEKLQHEYLENVSRIDRLSTFRGPSSASHRSTRVKEHLDVAKSMRMTRHLPGTAGFRQELSRSIKQQRSQSARTADRHGSLGSTDSHSATEAPPGPRSPSPRPPRSQSAVARNSNPAAIKGGTGIHAYVAEAARSMKQAATLSRAPSRAGVMRASSARPSVGRTESGGPSKIAQRPVSGRPASGRVSLLLTPDASVTMVSQDGSREGAEARRNDAAPGIMAAAPDSSPVV